MDNPIVVANMLDGLDDAVGMLNGVETTEPLKKKIKLIEIRGKSIEN